jgi:PAS domain S-box-containing protein
MSALSKSGLSALRTVRAWLGSDDSFHAKLVTSAAAGVAAIVLLAGVFLTFHLRERHTGHLRDVTFAILRLVERLEADLTAVEGFLRDYLLTGEADFLDQYRRRQAVLSARLTELTALSAAHPDQLEAAARLRENVAQWESRIAEPQIALRTAGRDPQSLPMRQKGTALLESIRLGLAHFSRRQADAWEWASKRAERQRLWQTGGFGVLSLLAVSLLAATSVYSYRTVRRHFSRVVQAETQLRLLVEHTLDALLTIDEEGQVLLANPAAARLFGTSEGELVGRPIATLILHESFTPGQLRLGAGTFEADARHAADPLRTTRVEISLSELPQAGRWHYAAVVRDIQARAFAEAERKLYQLSLAEEKERLDVTLRSIGDGCVTIDRHGRILLLNPVAERMTGWPAEAAVGCFLAEVFQLSDSRTRRPLRRPLETLIATGSAVDLGGVMVLTAIDGTERQVEINASPLRDLRDVRAGAVLVLRDVSERQRATEELQKAEKLESLGVAAGGIAHDFNNLLTAILGNLSLTLLSDHLEAGTQERLAAAKRASLRAQELAQQLLTFAKGGSPVKAAASLGSLVKDTVTFHLRGSKTRVEFDVPADVWAAEVDAGQISQVVQNLAINADQAMPAGGTLRVSCANCELTQRHERLGLPPGRYVKICVQDEGIGIPAENLKKIFDPYFTTKPKGTGLGLATSYSIVKAHGGFIDCTSAPGQGTSFFVFLPASESAVAAPLPEAEAKVPAVSIARAARVLVLDDEEAICALVTCALQPFGIEVVETNDAFSAIEKYRTALEVGRRFDLVISDLTIPGGMGGLEAVRRLREIDPQVRAIVSSGYAMDPVMASYREYGFCAMIAKPYEINALARVVAEVLGQSAASNVIAHNFAAA